MWKQFTVQGNTIYLDILPKILSQNNNTKHSSIKMTPVEASKKKNENTLYFNLYGDMEQLSSKPKFKIGDKVRISKYKRKVFDKGYTPNWREEIFLIDKIQSTNPITYRLKDLNNGEIQGSFYEPELLPAKQDVFRIEKVIRRDYKKKQALVKWLGYSDDFVDDMDDHIRKPDTKIQKLEEEIGTLHHKKLISKKLETVKMSLTGVLGAIFETEEEEEEE